MIQMCMLNSGHSEGHKFQYHGCAWVLLGLQNANITQDMTSPYVKTRIIIHLNWITVVYDNCLLGFMERIPKKVKDVVTCSPVMVLYNIRTLLNITHWRHIRDKLCVLVKTLRVNVYN